MTDVRTFRAASMQAALDLVRQEMGGDAVILHTRQVPRRRWLPWNRRREDVEITAGAGVNVRPVAGRKRSSPSLAEPAAPPLPTGTASRTATAAGRSPCLDLITPDISAAETASLPVLPDSQGTPARDQGRAHSDQDAAALADQLQTIRKMLESLTTHSRPAGAAEIPAELFDLYAELIDAEVEDALAREFILRLKEHATPAQLQDPAATRALLTAMVEADLCVGAPIAVTPGRRNVVALVGSTGVGKTTTIAKLAANFRLRDGIKMGLVTVDTYRIAAVEQLRTYAEIIDLPMKVVTSPLDMRRAMDELVGLDLVLIDTAGRSPRDDLQIQELKRLLAEAGTEDVRLVLSLTSSLRSLEATVEKFKAVNTTGLILTKLDEAAGMGTLLSLARKVPLPVSYLTTGQDVPDDIEPANKTRIARLILGQEHIG
ncbi:MAG TPA: flagellar biosynthesis protein FlhF [Planctomycetaceae bacterium]|nr:flagellar biosynthesis protein FlhF [Planctomycetaceae bacterium]